MLQVPCDDRADVVTTQPCSEVTCVGEAAITVAETVNAALDSSNGASVETVSDENASATAEVIATYDDEEESAEYTNEELAQIDEFVDLLDRKEEESKGGEDDPETKKDK